MSDEEMTMKLWRIVPSSYFRNQVWEYFAPHGLVKVLIQDNYNGDNSSIFDILREILTYAK